MVFPKKLWLTITDKLGFSFIHPQYLARRHFLWFIKKTIKYAKGKLIDIGCGTKPYKKYYSTFVDSYTGLDHPTTSKMYTTDEKPEIFGDLLNLPLKNNSFDTVLLFEVLEHVKNPDKAISEIERILKPNGYLFLTVPFIYPVHDAPHDYLRYTEFYLKDLFEQRKLKIVKLYSIGSFWELWFQFFILSILIKIKRLIKKLSFKNVIYISMLLIFFIPFYLTVNFIFFLLGRIKKQPSTSEAFQYEYFLIAKRL